MTDFIEDLPDFFITDEFATPITIDGVDAKGIYTPAFEDAFGIETRNKQLVIQESVKIALDVDHQSIVFIDGSYHRVRGIEPEGTGLVMLQLENDPTYGPVAPVANAGQDQTIAEGSPMILDGAATTGSIPLTYLWVQTSGTNVTITNNTQSSTTVTGATVGVYTFSLQATNAAGSSTDNTTVTVQ